MPVQFDGTDARISTTDTVGAPTALPITMACVVRFDAVTRWHGLLQIATNSVARGIEWEINNTNNMHLSDNSGSVTSFASTGSVAANVWYFLATTVTSAASNNVRHFCYNLETKAIVFNETATRNPWTYTGPAAGEDYTIGAWTNTGASFSDFMDGTLDWIAIYNRDYNTTESMLVLATLGPYALGIPVGFWDLLDGVEGATTTVARERINGNTGTLTNVNFDSNGGWRPVSLSGPWWQTAYRYVIRPQAGGGTLYTTTVAGTFTPVGVLVKQVNKALSAGLTPVGLLVKSVRKVLSGVVGVSGTLAVALRSAVSLAGSLTPVGLLVKRVNKTLLGTVTPTGVLSKQVNKVFVGVVTPLGVLSKQVNKVLSGALSFVGSISSVFISGGGTLYVVTVDGAVALSGVVVKGVNKVVGGVVTPTGVVVKRVGKILVGVVTPVGGVINAARFSVILAGAVALSGSLVKRVGKVLSGSVGVSGSVVKRVSKVLGGVVTPVGSVVKVVSKRLSGSVTPVGGLVVNYIRRVTLSGAVGLVGLAGSLTSVFIAGSGVVLSTMLPWFRRKVRR